MKTNYPKTVAELEKEIFDSSDSDDSEDFSFLKRTAAYASKRSDEVKSSGSNEDSQTSMFMIDRAADSDKTSLERSTVTHGEKTSKDSLAGISCAELINKLSKAPTELQIPQEICKSRVISKAESTENEVMKKAVVGADFEKNHAVPAYSEGRKALARKRREEKSRTKTGWFDMKAPEMTEELEADLEAMQMRGSAASWTGYKKSDYKKGPKFFQIATVEDSAVDFYHSRIPRKERKRTIVDELLADADFRRNNKKMFMKASEHLNKRHPNKKGGRHKKAKVI